MMLIERQGTRESFAQGDAGLPAKNSLDVSPVRVIISDIDPLVVSRERTLGVLASAIHVEEELGQILEAEGAFAAQIEHPAIRVFAGRSQKQACHGVIYVGEIAQLV